MGHMAGAVPGSSSSELAVGPQIAHAVGLAGRWSCRRWCVGTCKDDKPGFHLARGQTIDDAQAKMRRLWPSWPRTSVSGRNDGGTAPEDRGALVPAARATVDP